jgi:site-specific DNA-methyltransferase (adenine-specific)
MIHRMKRRRGRGVRVPDWDEHEKMPKKETEIDVDDSSELTIKPGDTWDVVTDASEALQEAQDAMKRPEDWRDYPVEAAHWALTHLMHAEAADKPTEINAETRLRALYETGRWLVICRVPLRKTGRPSKASGLRTLSPLERLLERFRSKHDRRMEGRLRLIGSLSRQRFEAWMQERKAEGETVSLNGLEAYVKELSGQQDTVKREAQHAAEVAKFNSNLAKLKAKGKLTDESELFRFEKCDFQKLDLTKSPARPSEKPKAIITDPPYLKEHVLRDPKTPNVPSLIENFAAWCGQVLEKDGLVAVLFGGLWTDEAVRIFSEAGFQRRWTLTTIYEGGNWARLKHLAVLSCSKPVLVFQRPGEQHGKMIEGDVIHCGKRDKDFHIWQQDVETFEQIVALLTDPTDLVVDAFAATATTGIACLNLKRRFIGSEIDPKAYKTGLWRLRKCVHEGKTWRKGYQKLREPPTFDKLGKIVYGSKISVGEEVGEDGERRKVDE